MSKILKIAIVIGIIVGIIVGIIAQDEIYDLFTIEDVLQNESSILIDYEDEQINSLDTLRADYFVNNHIYRWDELSKDWVVTKENHQFETELNHFSPAIKTPSTPSRIDWEVLVDIKYRLRYFAEVRMEMYSPIFNEKMKALHGKEVIIEGFVIPFDEEGEILSLSYNPYASCFFCGKASPASVLSIYLKDDGKRYKLDDFKKFKGTLHLNHDDPNQFYYILRDAKEQ